MLLLLAAGCVTAAGAAGARLKTPAWTDGYGSATRAVCVNGGSAHNTRWTFYGLPEGTPPPGGWPVYLIFPPWPTSPRPQDIPSGQNGTCGDGLGALKFRPPFVSPISSIVSPCFAANGSWNPRGVGPSGLSCGFTSVNGQIWDMRIKQFLLANGIAVVQVNTATMDSWDWNSQTDWDTGEDRPFLTTLFRQWRSGAYGGLGPSVLNPERMGVSGYSVGAQMVSWMIQLHGSGALKTLGAAVKAGAFFGGGSYACYRYPPSAYEPPDPTQPPPLGQCANCNASSSCMTAGCSNKIRGITGLEPCCQFCCPANFTEQHYHDHPADYKSHPPTFITQHSTVDENADLCAGLNYHREMLAHGATSELNLIAPKLGAPRPDELNELKQLLWAGDERCYCMGEAGEKAADGSTDSKYCPGFLPGLAPCTKPTVPASDSASGVSLQHETECFYDPTHDTSGLYEDHSTQRCVYHGMGFPEMVVPLVSFLMREL